jgi:putative intracellular protease/amidase
LSNDTYLVAGKRASAFTSSEELGIQLDGVVPFLLASELRARGAEHQPAPDWSSNVSVDGLLARMFHQPLVCFFLSDRVKYSG